MQMDECFRLIVRDEVERAFKRFLDDLRREAPHLFVSQGDEGFVSKKAAAALLGVSRETIDNWVRQGMLRRYGIGRIVRFKRSELHAAMTRPSEKKEWTKADIEQRAREILEHGRELERKREARERAAQSRGH